MTRLTVSAVHSLQLIPVDALSRFAQVQGRVSMLWLERPVDVMAVPGSVRVTSDNEEGIYRKTITFRRAPVDLEGSAQLEALSGCLLLAVYVDENGNRRVAGSPDCPLRLSYSSGEGTYMCTLSGEGVSIDPFLI